MKRILNVIFICIFCFIISLFFVGCTQKRSVTFLEITSRDPCYIRVGYSTTITATIRYHGDFGDRDANLQDLTLTSSDPRIVHCNATLTINGDRIGEATVTVTSKFKSYSTKKPIVLTLTVIVVEEYPS